MSSNFSKIKLTKKENDYAQWYLDVAKNWDLFEYSPTPWCITFLPKAVNIWEKIKSEIDKRLVNLWVQNIYLPLLIPMSFFEKEKEHIEWFAPELAVVTHWWWNELEEKLAIRPTSETLFCDFFKWRLQSYRDLPLLYNQWVNVMRWEKRTRPFLRTTEFYWQEGHTLHETEMDARDFALNILNKVYIEVLNDLLAIPWIAWQKSESEKFAWAVSTFTYEPMMSNGWALQICTSHLLSRDFMKQFDVSYLDNEWKQDYPYYTSWWMSTRSIWWIISSHSDDKWLIIPPKLSEYQAVILPIYWKDNEKVINNYARKIAGDIAVYHQWEPDLSIKHWVVSDVKIKWESFKAFMWNNTRVLVDYRNIRLWEKLTDFELSWYPIAIIIWEKDEQNQTCEIRSRITWEKKIIWNNPLVLNKEIYRMLKEWQDALLENSKKRLNDWIIACSNVDEIWKVLESWKFAIYEWDQNPNFEKEIKDKFKATTRCIPFEWQFTDNLLKLKNKNNVKIIVARAF